MVDPDRLEQYLNSVCESGQAWWKLRAKFIEEIDDATWFEFGLKVKRVEPKGWEETSRQQNQPQPVLTALDGYGNVPVLVMGSPGAGKSTLLAKVLFERAKRALKDATSPIPVLIELNLYRESGIWGLIQAALEIYDLYLEIPEIKQLVETKRLLLLADGVNELAAEKARLELTTFCRRQISMIFTTRDLGGDLGIEHKLEVQPLRPEDVETFLRDRLPRQNQKRIQELCDRARDFGQTPLMVWMLYSIFQGTGETPSTRGEAYQAFTNLYAEKAKEGIDLDHSRPLLAKLAFAMMQGDKPTELRLDISEVEAENLLGSKNLKHLWRHHLLQRFEFGRKGNYRIRFCHQSLQEYYAAEALLQKLPDISDYTLKRDYLNYLKWTEAIVLMLGLPEITNGRVVQLVRLSLQTDLLLGAKLSGLVKQELQKRSIQLIEELEVSNVIRVMLLGITQLKDAIPELLKILESKEFLSALESEDISICKSVIYAISKIDKELASSQASPVVLRMINRANLEYFDGDSVCGFSGFLGSRTSRINRQTEQKLLIC